MSPVRETHPGLPCVKSLLVCVGSAAFVWLAGAFAAGIGAHDLDRAGIAAQSAATLPWRIGLVLGPSAGVAVSLVGMRVAPLRAAVAFRLSRFALWLAFAPFVLVLLAMLVAILRWSRDNKRRTSLIYQN